MRVRIRRIAKWGCLSLGAMMLVAAVVGCWWSFGWILIEQHRGSRLLTLKHVTNTSVAFPRIQWPLGTVRCQAWLSERTWRPMRLLPSIHFSGRGLDLAIPMHWLAGMLLVAGAALWRQDRRRGAHACSMCGYDRHGLAEGAVCPECGSTPPPQSPLRDSASPR